MVKFEMSATKIKENALLEHEHLKQNNLLSTTKTNTISYDNPTVLVHNFKSLSKDFYDIVGEDRTINNDIIELPETQMNLSNSASKIIETLNFFQY